MKRILLLLPLALACCAQAQRLAELGQPPGLTPSADPTADPGYKQVHMPMPRPQPAEAAFVRVAGLPAAGDNGVCRQAACLQDRAVNHRPQPFRGQRQAAVNQLSALVDF